MIPKLKIPTEHNHEIDMAILRLNSNQLNYLIYIQSLDDWHLSGLLQEIPKHKENFAGDDAELNSLLEQLKALSISRISDFQTALNYLVTVSVEIS